MVSRFGPIFAAVYFENEQSHMTLYFLKTMTAFAMGICLNTKKYGKAGAMTRCNCQ